MIAARAMRRRRTGLAGFGLVALMLLPIIAGCARQQPIEAIDVRAITAVQAEIKRQIGVYMRAVGPAGAPVTVMVDGKPVPVTRAPGGFWCGAGNIDFDIASVKAELTTTLETSGGVSAGFTIPVSVVTLGPSVGVTHDVTNTQVLDYNLWPLERQDPTLLNTPASAAEIDGAPIARVLLDLRQALVSSAMRQEFSGRTPQPRPPQPCFTVFDPAKPGNDPGNSFQLGLTIVNDANGGVEVKTGILDFNANGEAKSTTGNTLTVTFAQRGVDTIQAWRDAVDDACKFPNGGSAKCQQATANYQDQLRSGGVGVLMH